MTGKIKVASGHRKTASRKATKRKSAIKNTMPLRVSDVGVKRVEPKSHGSPKGSPAKKHQKRARPARQQASLDMNPFNPIPSIFDIQFQMVTTMLKWSPMGLLLRAPVLSRAIDEAPKRTRARRV